MLNRKSIVTEKRLCTKLTDLFFVKNNGKAEPQNNKKWLKYFWYLIMKEFLFRVFTHIMNIERNSHILLDDVIF